MTRPSESAPVEVTHNETYLRLLETGTTLFAAHGFDGTSVRMIAEHAEANVAAVAYHFGSKRGLYDAVFERLYAQLRTKPITLPEHVDAMTGEELIRALAKRSWEFVEHHRNAVKMIVREAVNQGQLYEGLGWRWMAGYLEEHTESLAAVLDLPTMHVRMTLITISYALSRYALNNEEELVRITQAEDYKAARTRVIEHLGDLTVRMLLRP